MEGRLWKGEMMCEKERSFGRGEIMLCWGVPFGNLRKEFRFFFFSRAGPEVGWGFQVK